MKQRATHREGLSNALVPYLPQGTAPIIAGWIVEEGVQFVISKPRQSKLGDFRAGNRHRPSRISVNGDLNHYAFLITTVHEFAHLQCYKKHGHRVAPHGSEWKNIYTSMLKPFLLEGCFPPDIARALHLHLNKPSASSCSCPILNTALARFDDESVTFLNDITLGSTFFFQNQLYEAVEKRRTRFLCTRLSDGRKFLISGRAAIDVLPQKDQSGTAKP